MECDPQSTAVVFIDPQNDVLSPAGKNWAAVGASVTENKTVEHMREIFEAAKSSGYQVFISPHYFYPTDQLVFHGTVRSRLTNSARAHSIGLVRSISAALWFGRRLARRIQAVHRRWERPSWSVRTRCSVRKPTIWTLQLRKRKISKVILGGMLANMCVESHLRELIEQGFEVAVVKRCHGGAAASRLGGRLPGGIDKLQIPRPRSRGDRGCRRRNAEIMT